MEPSAQTALKDNPNFATLHSAEEYASYFGLIERISRLLHRCYQVQSGEEAFATNLEARMVTSFLGKLLATLTSLHMKYAHSGDRHGLLRVDLTESGFPNFSEIAAVERDLSTRDNLLREIPANALLKRNLLDQIFADAQSATATAGKDSAGVAGTLQQLAYRTYLEALNGENLFLPFIPGSLQLRAAGLEYRSYVFSFGCYDFATNRPYVHLMTFDQSLNDPELEPGTDQYQKLLEVMRAEGSRATDVGILALAVDDALEFIHPKIIKRVSIGPLYSPLLFSFRNDSKTDERETILRSIWNRLPGHEKDFILFVTDDIVFSIRQEVTKTIFSPEAKVREIFAIYESDLECYVRRASVVNHYALLPHRLLQHLSREDQQLIPGFLKARRYTVDDAENIHGV